uniref:Uncharacterized protein n=1 Tax=Arundo donax TaxID=35708 RepID=A0A0A9F1P8_ARUDO
MISGRRHHDNIISLRSNTSRQAVKHVTYDFYPP